jgi:hypothetical protein
MIDLKEEIVRDKAEVRFFREVLSDEAVGVFISASLPGGIGIGKEEIGIKAIGDLFVKSEFGAVIRSHRKDQVLDRQEFLADSVTDGLSRFDGNLFKKAIK